MTYTQTAAEREPITFYLVIISIITYSAFTLFLLVIFFLCIRIDVQSAIRQDGESQHVSKFVLENFPELLIEF